MLTPITLVIDLGRGFLAGQASARRFQKYFDESHIQSTVALRRVHQLALELRTMTRKGMRDWKERSGPLAHQMLAFACYLFTRNIDECSAFHGTSLTLGALPAMKLLVPSFIFQTLGRSGLAVTTTRLHGGYRRAADLLLDFPWEKVSTAAVERISRGEPCCSDLDCTAS